MYDPECVRLLGVLFLFSFLQAAKGQSWLTPNKIARADIEGGLRSPSGRTKLWCQAAFKAFSIHPIKWTSSNGLFRKQTAPAFMARARTLSLG